MDTYVHVSSLFNNAQYYWDVFSEKISFGDTSAMSKGSELSCVGHEYTHAVFRHKTGWTFIGKKPATINEAYADIFGSFIDNNNWRTSPRNIANPSKSNNPSYADTSDSNYLSDFSEEHKNSTIISHAAYLMNHTYNIPFDKLYDLWYDSLGEGYGMWSDFDTVRTNVIKSARKNNFSLSEISDIKKSFDKVGVLEDKGNVKITVLNGKEKVSSAKVTLFNYGTKKTAYITSANPGEVTVSDLEIGTNVIKVEISGHPPIFAQVLIKKDQL